MKLASLREGWRDGTLLVVSTDLTRAVRATSIAPTLQRAIEDWARVEPALRELSQALQAGAVAGEFAFDASAAMAPLPRAYHWVDGGGYHPHMTLMRKSRGVPMPANADTEPLFVQGNSDRFWGPRDPITLASDEWGIDLEGEIGIIVDDVPMAVSEADAAAHIKLLVLINDVSLRNLAPAELAKGFGFYQSKPNKAFAPVAVTPDECGAAWDGTKLRLEIHAHINGQLFGHPNAGEDFQFGFPTLLQHANKTRTMAAGTILGGGTVSNWDRSRGHVCINEKRALETVESGAARTSFLMFGDTVRIECFGPDGGSLFGAIEQRVERLAGQR